MDSIGTIFEDLSLAVIAERMETRPVPDPQVKAGVERFQGCFFHRPEPAAVAPSRSLYGELTR